MTSTTWRWGCPLEKVRRRVAAQGLKLGCWVALVWGRARRRVHAAAAAAPLCPLPPCPRPPPPAVVLLSLRAQLRAHASNTRAVGSLSFNPDGSVNPSRCIAVAWLPGTEGTALVTAYRDGAVLIHHRVSGWLGGRAGGWELSTGWLALAMLHQSGCAWGFQVLSCCCLLPPCSPCCQVVGSSSEPKLLARSSSQQGLRQPITQLQGSGGGGAPALPLLAAAAIVWGLHIV